MAEELRDITPLHPLLAHQPLALMLDIDGTVAPIVDNPSDAHITGRARQAIEALMTRGVRVAFVTGRALAMAHAMVNIDGAYFAANHGINIDSNGRIETPEAVRPYVEWVQDVIADLSDIHIPGIIVEDKGPVVAFHYRQAKSEAPAETAILAAIQSSPSAAKFRMQHGRKVIELRPPLDLDKGTAVESLSVRMGAASALCLGDDFTDMDMFRGVQNLRDGGLPGLNVAVWSPEIDPAVLLATDYFVRGVAGTEWLLEEILKAIPGTSG